ncbi:hypothetical protein GGF46_002318 [Coemansia sp. RSA 552]|nr:hypothetical protein GGF46_002318 [Coemansia sp. RSA 552]
MDGETNITSCHQIRNKQQRLLMQCYCKTEFNTLFVKYNKAEGVVVCNRMDRNKFHTNATVVCSNYRKYTCPGVRVISAAPTLSVKRVAIVALLVAGLLA